MKVRKNTGKDQERRAYHHGNLAESLLNAVDDIASEFGLEAVTLRACAKRVGVSPSSAFRHYTDKRALLTAFATRALHQLSDAMAQANQLPDSTHRSAFCNVGLAYISFAIDKPAFFRAMWREETIYANDQSYLSAAQSIENILKAGFADTLSDENPLELDAQELLAWSAVHGLANLFVDGPIARDQSRSTKLIMAEKMIAELDPLLATSESQQA